MFFKLSSKTNKKLTLILNMFLQVMSLSCNKVTLRTWISNSFMFIFDITLQVSWLSGGILSLRARTSYSLVFSFKMTRNASCCSWNILTLRTRIFLLHVYFQHDSSGDLLKLKNNCMENKDISLLYIYLQQHQYLATWIFKLSALVATNSQSEQEYLTLLCWFSTCFFRWSVLVATYSHS